MKYEKIQRIDVNIDSSPNYNGYDLFFLDFGA